MRRTTLSIREIREKCFKGQEVSSKRKDRKRKFHQKIRRHIFDRNEKRGNCFIISKNLQNNFLGFCK